MIEVSLYVSLGFAILALIFNKKKYSVIFSLCSILFVILKPLRAMELGLALSLLLMLIFFEAICFTYKTKDFHLFRKVKESRYKSIWLVICITVVFTLLLSVLPSELRYNLEKLKIESNFYIILIPILYYFYDYISARLNGNR